MTIETANGKKRKPLTAIILSLIMPGLGHVYCGRIVKGLLLAFLSGVFVPIILLTLMVDYSAVRMVIIGTSLFGSLVVQLIAIIDSYYVAVHTKPDYQLKEYNRWYVYVLLILIAMGGSTEVASNVRANYLEAFRIPNASNYPTLVPNDRFLANKLTYENNNPERGDLVVFLNPENRHQNYIKRIVAVAGDTIEIRNHELYINDNKLVRKELPQSALDKIRIYLKDSPLEGQVLEEINGDTTYKIFFVNPPHDHNSLDFAKITVPEHHCFVLGDNRCLSHDSRHFGPVPLTSIKGRADYLYCPAKDWSRFGKIKN